MDVNNVWIWSVTLAVSTTLLLFVSPRFEFSIKVLFGGDVVLICGIEFFNCKFNGNGLFSLIKLRGNCIVLSSLIFDDDVDDTSTTFELFLITIDDEEFWSDGKRSIEDDESANVRDDGGTNVWESTETVDDCVSKYT